LCICYLIFAEGAIKMQPLHMHDNVKTWKICVASGAGTGFLPFATGTWGSLIALLPFLPLYGQNSTWVLALGLIVCSLLGLIVGVRLAKELEPVWGDDPKEFVWDEVIGMWITLIGHAVTGPSLFIGFLAFRFFDIFKPLGIRRLERLTNGWGVMLDDVAAGVAANIVLWVYTVYFPDFLVF
jgi:phosphatidylglycerophosphatase A